MTKSVSLALILICALFTTSLLAQTSADERAILTTVDKFFAALGDRDREGLEAVLVADSLNISSSVTGDGATRFSSRNYQELLSALSRPGAEQALERYWDETVLVRRDIAIFWAPYDFHVGAEFSHCGVDSFQLIKRDGSWLITNLSWTIERENCAPSPLGPVQ